MSLPSNWTIVPVSGQYLYVDGTPAQGQILFSAPSVVLADGSAIFSKPLIGVLSANGQLSINLPATNDPDTSPTGWAYQVTEMIVGQIPNRSYFVQIDYQAGSIDLPSLAPVVSFNEMYPSIPYSLSPGTVTTLPSGSNATINIRGSVPNQIIDIGIPEGKPGTSGAGTTYIYNQGVANNSWVINHSLDKYPSVTVVDSSGNEGFTTVQYVDSNNVILTFSASFAGQAFLN